MLQKLTHIASALAVLTWVLERWSWRHQTPSSRRKHRRASYGGRLYVAVAKRINLCL